MPSGDDDRIKRILDDVYRSRAAKEKTYRDRALKMFPHVCARCGREFEGKRVRELTVHHKDHNHDNNPPDGSNWELLCLYCHDNEHDRTRVAQYYDKDGPDRKEFPGSGFKPFAGLADLLRKKHSEPEEK